MERFSRRKRFFGNFSHQEFLETAEKLIDVVKATHPSLQVEVLTCEDLSTHRFHKNPFDCDEVDVALQERKSYTLEQFTPSIWGKSLDVELLLQDPGATHSCWTIFLFINKMNESRLLKFYMQCEEELAAVVRSQFAQATLYYQVTTGGLPPSDFNVAYGMHLRRKSNQQNLF